MPRKTLEELCMADFATLKNYEQLRVLNARLRAIRPWDLDLRTSYRRRELPRCGARCRDGHACQAPAAWDDEHTAPRNGRCRRHGGLSTGPRTLAGKRRIAEAVRWRRRSLAKAYT